jgi:hypothetical protein
MIRGEERAKVRGEASGTEPKGMMGVGERRKQGQEGGTPSRDKRLTLLVRPTQASTDC